MEGEPSTHVFVLLSGWVKVITVSRDGREILEALRGEGDLVGEIAGQVTGYRTATVQAVGTVRALIVGADRFEGFLDANPRAAHAYRQAMTQRARVAYEQQRSHALLSGAQRLAGLLLDLAGQQSDGSRGSAALPLPLSQEELASLIGASRSTVTRALREWRSRRIIGTDQRHIEILDRTSLLHIADRSPKAPLSAHGKPLPPRMRLKNADHWADENVSSAPSGSPESLTSTECFLQAISTHSPPPPLALLVRQVSVECRLCRAGIQHPSIRRIARRLAATRDEGVEPAGVNRAYAARYLVDIPRLECKRFCIFRLCQHNVRSAAWTWCKFRH